MTNTVNATLTPFQVVMYTEGAESRVPQGYRLSLIRWKMPTEKELKANPGALKKPNVCVALPGLSLAVVPACLAVALQEALEDIQDNAVRSFITGKIEETSGVNLASLVVPAELGTAEGLRDYAAKKTISARLSGDSLGAWFDSRMSGPLVDLVVSKLEGTEGAAEIAVGQVVKARAAIVALASPRAVMPQAVAMQLAKAIGATVLKDGEGRGDKTVESLMKKLEFFINPPKAEELLLSL